MTDPAPEPAPTTDPTPSAGGGPTAGTELVFTTAMPGLTGLTRFALVPLDDAGALFSLRSLDRDGTRLIVAAPWVCAPDYAPHLDDATCAELDLTREQDATVLLVVHPGTSIADSTVNLLAPIVVNTTTRRALQVVLADSDLPLRAPLVAA